MAQSGKFDVEKVFSDMIAAASTTAKDQWPKLKEDAEDQFRVLAQVAGRVAERTAKGTLSETDARFLMSQHAMATQNVLYAIEGQAKLLLEAVINAALDVLRAALKAATKGWVLI